MKEKIMLCIFYKAKAKAGTILVMQNYIFVFTKNLIFLLIFKLLYIKKGF